MWIPGLVGPLLQHSLIGWFIYDATTGVVTFMRHLLGIEHLLLLGFRNFERRALSDCKLRELAGLSINVVVCALYHLLMLASVDFKTPYSALRAKALASKVIPPALPDPAASVERPRQTPRIQLFKSF